MNNAEIASILRQQAGILTLEGADRFRTKAYQRAAQTIESLDKNIEDLLREGADLTRLPAIGKGIASAIAEIATTGGLERLSKKIETLAPELGELTKYPALDPKKIQRIYKKLGISGIDALRDALQSGAIAKALGERIAYHVTQGLADRPRKLLYLAEQEAEAVERVLNSQPGIEKVSRSGSLRRKKDTVADLGFLVATTNPKKVLAALKKSRIAVTAEDKGLNGVLLHLGSGNTATVVCSDPEDWGTQLLTQTGSAAHLAELSSLETKAAKRKKLVKYQSEEKYYQALGLPYIEPELREGRGEIKAAEKGSLPTLVELKDIRGDLHMHTTASDGANSIAEMAAAAKARGYEYIAISDHSQSLKLTNGLSEKRLLAQCAAIDKFNAKAKDIVVMKASEVDILEDGSLDYPKAVLEELDLCICSIHSRFALNKEKQTERILRAMDNKYFTILGHATGRLLLKREGYEIDMLRILKHAKANGCFVEINSSPDRLDLSDEDAFLARELGVLVAIDTDAHSVEELSFMPYGLNQARRAWLEPKEVLNTRRPAELRKLFKR